MKRIRINSSKYLVMALSCSMLLLAGNSPAQQAGPGNNPSIDLERARVIEYWTNDRRAGAIPRDLVIDSRGLGYLRRPDGTLQPYGNQIVAEGATTSPLPNARPSGGDNLGQAPVIDFMDPGQTDVIGASHTFSATVTDDVAVKSVSFTIQYPGGSTTQTFSANAGAGNLWTVTLSGFTDGNWSWWVVAKDTAKRGGNTATSPIVDFEVVLGGGGVPGGDSGDTVGNANWTFGGKVQTAAGRLYFEMPRNARRNGRWIGYVCSGTAVTDATKNNRSVILTAAHCVYDDVNKAFTRNVLYIPNQADTDGSGTDLDCSNDPLGCWVPSFGVVDVAWTKAIFPDNIPWDYAYYVVPASRDDTDMSNLEVAAGTLAIDFTEPDHDDGTSGSSSDDFTYGLGYSYDVDPNFMYCADDMTTEGADNWWLPNCGLSGGSSGGPWVQPMDTSPTGTPTGTGPVISVNSWGYVGLPGMAGPKLYGTSAECVFGTAESESTDFAAVPSTDGNAGVVELYCAP